MKPSKVLLSKEAKIVADAARSLHMQIGLDSALAVRGLDTLNRRVDGTKDNIGGIGSGLDKMGATFGTQMSGLDKSFTLWERNSGDFATTMERKQRQIGLVTDKSRLLEREIERTTGELIGVTREFGQGTEAASRLENQLLDLQIQQADYNKELKRLTSFDWDGFDRLGDKFTGLGTKMSLGVTAPLAAVGVAGIRSFVQLEDSWTGVEKVTNGTKEELSELRQQMNSLVTDGGVPLSVTEMYGIAQAAGRLGIEMDNVKGFSQTVAMLGTVTNMTAEQAATDMAQFATVMQMPQEKFDQLGATLVGLGNNMAATESDIMRMGARLTGAGNTVGMAEAEVLGFAAGFSALGISAEAGGTAFTNVMLSMQDAVFNMDDNLDTFANVAGKNVDEFATLFEKDATTAILYFIEGLGRLDKAGLNTNEIFSDLGFNSVNIQDILRRGAGAGDTLRDAINLANDSWEENSALTKAAGKRYGTTAAEMQVFRNRVELLSEKIGSDLQHKFAGLLNIGSRVVGWLSDLDDGTRSTLVTVGMIAAGIGPALLGIGAGIKIIGQMRETIGTLRKGFRAVSGIFGGGAKIFGALTSPIGLTVLAIGALIAIGFILYKNWDRITEWFKDKFPGAFETITSVIEGVRGFIDDNIGSFKGIFSGFTDFIGGIFSGDLDLAFSGLGQIFTHGFDILSNLAQLGFDAIFGFFETLIAPLEEKFPFVFDVLSDVLGIFKGTVSNTIDGVKQIFGGIIDLVAGVFTGDWERAWTGVVNIFGGIFGTLGGLVKVPINAVISIVNRALDGINGVSVDVPSWVPGIGGQSFGMSIPRIPMLAKGTDNHIGGPAIVGEEGPELVFMPRGSKVIPNDESTKMLLGRAGRSQMQGGYSVDTRSKGASGVNLPPAVKVIIEKIVIGGDEADSLENRVAQLKAELKTLFADIFGELWEDEWYKLSLKYPNLTES